MRSKKMWNLMVIIAFVLPVLTGYPVRGASLKQDFNHPESGDIIAPNTPNDVPDQLVASGVTDYTIVSPKIFWYTKPPCVPAVNKSNISIYDEVISRIPYYGGITRVLYDQVRNSTCTQQIIDVISNIIADNNYVYWMSSTAPGLVKLPVTANSWDVPSLINGNVTGLSEITEVGDTIYVMNTSSIYSVNKLDGEASFITDTGASPSNFQTDGKYLYWITGGWLKRFSLISHTIASIEGGVSGYYPEGEVEHCSFIGCNTTEYIFIGEGRSLVRYNNVSNTPLTLYTSTDPSALIYSLVADGHKVYFFESIRTSCDLFCDYQAKLYRSGQGVTPTPDILFYSDGHDQIYDIHNQLKALGDYLYWSSGALNRIPKDASTLPLINLSLLGIKVTQAIQNDSNSVFLFENKRTFALVTAEADGSNVPGVTAYLYRVTSTGDILDGPLTPVNPIGQNITVKNVPLEWLEINDNFLFELPWSWTTGELYMRAILNPYHFPAQASYENNTMNYGPFLFLPSPRLPVQIVSFGYEYGGNVYWPREQEDIQEAFSWIRRAYPLASTPGGIEDPSPGFRPGVLNIFDNGLGLWVSRLPCSWMDAESLSLCSSLYTNMVMNAMHENGEVPENIPLYGMVSMGAGFWVRGWAWPDDLVASGGALATSAAWVIDGSNAGLQAGHEIGHLLGRYHPDQNADNPDTDVKEGCGHIGNDPNYPYYEARISNGSVDGFDTGDPGITSKFTPTIYPWYIWHDNMSYCDFRWTSDYTYLGMYFTLLLSPFASDSNSVKTSGDYLSVQGVILRDKGIAAIGRLTRMSNITEIPPITPGDYSIRLLNGEGSILGDNLFTPKSIEDATQSMLSINQVVNFIPGTTKVQIVKISDQSVLVEKMVSPNLPTISDVALQAGTPNPVSGDVTLTWVASDADHDSLTFDVLYSRDNSSTFQPLQLGVKGNSTLIDTSLLGGSSTAIFRVIASDGVNTAHADSAAFVMTDKPPVPMILLPADVWHVHYGQLVNFSGQADDYQDGSIIGTSLVWINKDQLLGTGPLLSISDLPVGENTITLSATNTEGLSASTSVTVYVDDDLDLPGPTLDAAPTIIGWQVSAGTTDVQTADVYVTNAGSGSLSWEAKSGADWLSVEPLSGTDDYTITLSVDPSGLTSGVELSTNLELTALASTDNPTQTLNIPVTLSVGDTWSNPGLLPQWFTYLPLLSNSSR